MQNYPIQLSDVIYNAATQTYDALVTVHDSVASRKYACSVQAPITMTFEDAAKGLRKQALRRHAQNRGMYSQQRSGAARQRAGRVVVDPMRWLEQLVNLPGHRAA